MYRIRNIVISISVKDVWKISQCKTVYKFVHTFIHKIIWNFLSTIIIYHIFEPIIAYYKKKLPKFTGACYMPGKWENNNDEIMSMIFLNKWALCVLYAIV